MKIQLKSVWCFVLFVMSSVCLKLVVGRSYNNGLIFYDLQTMQPYLPPTVSVSRGRGLASVKFSEKGSIWSTFGKPCECRSHVCGCCAGIKVKQYNFDQKMCANVTFVPPKEEALLEVYLNERQSSKYGISVRNPSPFCIPVMMGVPMAMCVQMSDIAIKGNNLNMCMDFIVRLATTDLFEMHFQCMQMGLDGFQYIDKDGKPVIPPSNSKSETSEYDYYDYEENTDENENVNENENETENEISYGVNVQPAVDSVPAVHNDQQFDIEESTYNGGLQQQLQQLQAAQQIEIAKDDLVTQIHESTTFAPIVVEAETEEIATISTTTPAAAETLLPATTVINPIDNDYGNDAPINNYNNAPTTVTSASSTTTEGAISKPIAAPINAYADATESENTDAANSYTDAAVVAGKDDYGDADIAESVDGTLLENITTNYAADTLSATESDADIETTALPIENPTTTYLGASAIATTTTTTTTAATIEVEAINSTAYEAAPTEPTALPNQFKYASNATITSSTVPTATTSSATTVATAATEPAVHAVDSVDASTTPLTPQAAAIYASYRQLYG